MYAHEEETIFRANPHHEEWIANDLFLNPLPPPAPRPVEVRGARGGPIALNLPTWDSLLPTCARCGVALETPSVKSSYCLDCL